MEVLVLYSWEGDSTEAKQWATSMCYEISRYENINASCDMFWNPSIDVKKEILEKIETADKIIVIVTNSYNYKVSNSLGMVSYEERIYNEIITKEKANNQILFILKEKNIAMPEKWENFFRIDASVINKYEYLDLQKEKKKSIFDRIARFCLDLPEYTLLSCEHDENNDAVYPKKALSYDSLFKKILKKKIKPTPSIAEQEKKLVQYIKKNMNDKTFVYDYLRSGLSADLSFSGKMTPELFDKYFCVRRSDREEQSYNDCIRDLFNADSYNVLCLQADGGSGKSVFIQSLAFRGKSKKGKKYIYYNRLFDLSHFHDNQLSKEELVYKKLRKEYMRMSRDDAEDQVFVGLWRENFSKMLSMLNDVECDENSYLFKLNLFRKELKKAIQVMLSPGCCEIDTWYEGYSNRLSAIRTSVKDKNVLFMILLTIYLLILLCKPTYDKEPRYIFLFDNIETYDNGEEAKAIAEYITGCHSFLKKIFCELGEENTFFTRFTFVFVLRTSTFFRFGSLQANLLRGGAFNKQLKYFDFTIEAMLKKIKFLKKIHGYQDSVLFRELYFILSIIIPSTLIDEYLNETKKEIDIKHKYFASHRLIPLFNNDYRKTVEYLYRALMDDEIYDTIIERIKKLYSSSGINYDCGINGIRMIIIRFIFNDLMKNEYFDKIGFSGLSGKEEHSMTRILLSLLYWDEIKCIAIHRGRMYKGMSLDKIFNIFKHFCNVDQIVQLLYDLSVYVNNDSDRKEALDAWGNLITFTDLKTDIKSLEFYESANNLVNKDIKEHDIAFNKIFVKLSDAGMCFSQYYSRNIEFIMSRSNNGADIQSLFLMDDIDDIKNILSDFYTIIVNCIEKMIGRCEPICALYGHEKSDCVLLSRSRDEYKLFSCSLFIRYQECFDLIREAINYIDRYRIVMCNSSGDKIIIDELNNQLIKFYKLYSYTREEMLKNAGEQCRELESFMQNWDYSINKKYNSVLELVDGSRINNVRPIQSYYALQNEDINYAVKNLSKQSSIRLHKLILDLST